MDKVEKQEIIKLFIETLTKSLQVSNESIKIQKDFIADSPGPMQSRYDSAMVEGQWLLDSKKESHDKLVYAVSCLKKLLDDSDNTYSVIESGSLIILDDNNGKSGYLLLDAKGGAGASVLYDGIKYMMITPQSPFGKALLGKKAGDTMELKTSKTIHRTINTVL